MSINLNSLENLTNDEITKINNINGLMSSQQYKLIYKLIKFKSPCNLLIFGVGDDSYLWNNVNNNGTTIFLENIKEWADKFKDLDIINVKYKTTVLDYPNNLNEENLLLDLPDKIIKKKWDIIIVDSPVGHYPPCKKCNMCSITNPAPGRMSSIYTASKLTHSNSIIIVDDINREIEKKSSDNFLKNFKQIYNDKKLLILN